jgi:hypothetical protein
MTIDLDADPFWLLPDETAVPVLAVLRVRDRIGATTSTQSSASFITASAKKRTSQHTSRSWCSDRARCADLGAVTATGTTMF